MNMQLYVRIYNGKVVASTWAGGWRDAERKLTCDGLLLIAIGGQNEELYNHGVKDDA